MGANRWWAYPGNLQGRNTKSTECGPKGALIVPITADGFGRPEFEPCDAVRFERLDIDVSAAEDLGEVVDIADQELRTLEDEADGRTLVVRVRLVGSSPAHDQLHSPSEILDTLREQSTRSVLIAKVEVATRGKVDRSQLKERQDLLSDVLNILDQIEIDPETVLSLVKDHELPPMALRRLESLLRSNPETVTFLIAQADSLLVDLLGETT